MPINEWAFAAEIKTTWDIVIHGDPVLAGLNTRVEEQSEAGGLKRSDVTLRDGTRVLVAGELRLPDHRESDPWSTANIAGAREKALNFGARWAFTSDANTLLLIDPRAAGSGPDLVVNPYEVGLFVDREDIDRRLDEAKDAWRAIFELLLPVFRDVAVPVRLPDDERFIRLLRAALRRPVHDIADALDRHRLSDPSFASDLILWMVNDQGWAHDPTRWSEEIRSTALLSAYVFTTRLMFYEALRRAEPDLGQLGLTEGTPALAARGALQGFFEDARGKSRDYETLFVWDRACEYALIDDTVVDGWRRLLERLADFDLTRIDYDIVGRIFERLIEPRERYRFGQHYTSPSVVDLMLSFALPDGEGTVADMASGGGTFLVRAYVRKATLRPAATHQDLLAEIYGGDISGFAASLATLNLAIRDLSFTTNYPRVARKSFFEVLPGAPYMSVPAADGETLDVIVPRLRAFVCNPPYVRVQQIAPHLREGASRIIADQTTQPPAPRSVNRNANYHLYFWFHGARFLADDGKLVFITSTEWMDSDYGAALQEWLLRHFRLLAIIDSDAEPWFSEARVKTVVTVAERCEDPRVRDSNVVRFVRLRRPLEALYGSQATPRQHFASVDGLRDRILGRSRPRGQNDDMQWRSIEQGELWTLGLS